MNGSILCLIAHVVKCRLKEAGMNSSADYRNVKKQLGVRALYVDNGTEFRGVPAKQPLELAAPEMLRSSTARLKSTTAPSEQPSAVEEANYVGEPPTGLMVTSGDHDPKIIRFIDAPNIAMRRAALHRRMHEVSADGARNLVVVSVRGLASVRLNLAVVSATTKSASRARAVVGIDGVDQFVASPGTIACHIKSLTDMDVSVICTIDSRRLSWVILVFYLRVLGLLAIREKLAIDVCIDWMREKWSAKSEWIVCSLPAVGARAKAEFIYRRRLLDGRLEMVPDNLFNAPVKAKAPSRQVAVRSAAWLAAARREREDCARAYRNSFAIGQLLRESRIH
ncbi:hypothetical protein ABH945_004495 [Paraburkholderia sp. GAS333]|uniref:hypothetical protein n=1 Tax=Paraburkholderia sp. GAS333 TaxID=3156279 RepID=UPI003D19326D